MVFKRDRKPVCGWPSQSRTSHEAR